MAHKHSNSETTATEAMPAFVAQILSFINGADSVYSFAVMMPIALSTESVNAPGQGVDLYKYGTKQS
jgi:hypothetical protein